MEKKLPKVFVNPPEKKFENNEKVYYSKDNFGYEMRSETKKTDERDVGTEYKNVYQKLNDIFASERYVYKADVNITTRTGNIKTKIIGQNRTHIITMDNKLIAISDIQDINFIE